MRIFHPAGKLSHYIHPLKASGLRLGFVPTMGALHAGHLSLLSEARKKCDVLVCSIFVNPTQFNNTSDLEKYPRTLAADILLLEAAGCDILFLPDTSDLYSYEKPADFTFNGLDSLLEGASRPGHFLGVARVVKLLFELVQPDIAVFGLKDFQQCMVIQSLVKQFEIPVQLLFAPTLRESNGLAMSSRNMRLSADQREQAGLIYQCLLAAADTLKRGLDPKDICKEQTRRLEMAGLRTDYFQICEASSLQPVSSFDPQRDLVVLTAVFVGDVRLIDNLYLKKD